MLKALPFSIMHRISVITDILQRMRTTPAPDIKARKRLDIICSLGGHCNATTSAVRSMHIRETSFTSQAGAHYLFVHATCLNMNQRVNAQVSLAGRAPQHNNTTTQQHNTRATQQRNDATTQQHSNTPQHMNTAVAQDIVCFKLRAWH